MSGNCGCYNYISSRVPNKQDLIIIIHRAGAPNRIHGLRLVIRLRQGIYFIYRARGVNSGVNGDKRQIEDSSVRDTQ